MRPSAQCRSPDGIFRRRFFARFLFAPLSALLAVASSLSAQTPPPDPGAAIFEKQCYSCHNVGGGDKTGPDLMGIGKKQTPEWLHRFITSPKAMRDSGDPDAVAIFRQFAPEVMPDQTVTPEQIDQILAFIEAYTAQGKTFIPQTGMLVRAPTPADIPAGYDLFIGRTPLKNGGPSCISCHSVQGVGALDGGTLGFDLTNANTKYTTIELASILKAPAFPTMSRVFQSHALTDEEVVQVFAYLQAANVRTPDPARAGLSFVLLGAVGAVAGFGLAGLVWRNRFRAARQPLVERAKAQAGRRSDT